MEVPICDFNIGDKKSLTIICGPCVIENAAMLFETASVLCELFEPTPFHFIFKASYDKANRSSGTSFRGPGLEEGLRLLEEVKQRFGIPIFTDVHTPEEALEAGKICDMIQIPAFLSRQTDLLVAAGKSGAAVNIKKGQFMAPWDMKGALDKILATGNKRITLTERGTSFGYNNLVVDFRSIAIMQKLGFPVLFDATHAVQLPGALGTASDGEREYVPMLARASIAAGADGLYLETHPNPLQAKSDAATQIPLSEMGKLIEEWMRIYEAYANTLCAVQ